MKLKNFILSSLLFALLFAIGSSNQAFALMLDVEKNTLSGGLQECNEFSPYESLLIEEAYQTRKNIEYSQEKSIGEYLNSYFSDANIEDLVTSVDKKDKITAMNLMVQSLKCKTIENDMKILMENYIKKYAPYAGDENLADYASSLSEQSISTYASYNATSAVNYAYSWYNSYNTSKYPNCTNLGGDCANFVSQCLAAGGKATDDKWYITKKNSNYLAPTTVSQLNNSWTLADPSPWISAKQFNNYWGSKVGNETFEASYVYNNKSTIYNKDYYKGDVVQILKKNNWWWDGYHTMIITNYSGGDFTLTYHTSNRKDVTLNSIANSYNSSNYAFKFFNM